MHYSLFVYYLYALFSLCCFHCAQPIFRWYSNSWPTPTMFLMKGIVTCMLEIASTTKQNELHRKHKYFPKHRIFEKKIAERCLLQKFCFFYN